MPSQRRFWMEKCFQLPDLTKAMSTSGGTDSPAYDEVKVFEVEQCNPEAASQMAQRVGDAHTSPPNPIEETRQVLTAYGVRGLIPSRSFSAAFLWYNILPGRSVPIRRLPVHLFEMRADAKTEQPVSVEDLETLARKAAEGVAGVRSVGECFVTRVAAGFLVAVNIAVDAQLLVAEGRRIADGVMEVVRGVNPNIRHLFVQVFADEKLF